MTTNGLRRLTPARLTWSVLAALPLLAACQAGSASNASPSATSVAYTAGYTSSEKWVSADLTMAGHRPAVYVVSVIRQLCVDGGNEFSPARKQYRGEAGGIEEWTEGCVQGQVTAYAAAGVPESADGPGAADTSAESATSEAGNVEGYLALLRQKGGWTSSSLSTDNAALLGAGRATCDLLTLGLEPAAVKKQMIEAGIVSSHVEWVWAAATQHLCPEFSGA